MNDWQGREETGKMSQDREKADGCPSSESKPDTERKTADLGGRWVGRLQGTNSGTFVLTLDQNEAVLKGDLRLNDFTLGLAVFDVTGAIEEHSVTFVLTPREAVSGVELREGSAKASLQADGTLTGTWGTHAGTFGTFVAVREGAPFPVEPITAPTGAAATAISYEKKTRVPSCVVDNDSLKRLYRDLSTGADEAARLDLARRQQLSDGQETVHQPTSLALVRALYSVTIIARGESGEQIVTLDAQMLSLDVLPKPLKSITLDVGFYYRLRTNGVDAQNRASVTLDFTKPPLVDLRNASGSPTPNESAIAVYGNDSIWVAGVFERIGSTLAQGRVRTGWLHSAYVYDGLFFAVGMPVGLATAAATASAMTVDGRSAPYVIAVFLFVLYAALMAFRIGFSFVRWLLPYVEFSRLNEPVHRQIRLVIATLTLGILTSLAAAAIWAALM
jgi:hypothetical protein